MNRVLIVEDEPELATLLTRALAEAGYEPQAAHTGSAARSALNSFSPDLILLDVMLPDTDGFSLLPLIREATTAPVLMLTAKVALNDRVRGLDGGADDYLVKPFRLRELLARMRAVMRRSAPAQQMSCGPLTMNLISRDVKIGGRNVYLSATEFSLLELLASNLNRTVAKQEILEKVWKDSLRDTNVVEVYITYLRQKLERQGSPRLVHTVRGKGYQLSLQEPV